MIKNFKSKALRKFWQHSDASGIRPDWLKKVSILLDAIDSAETPEDLDFPGSGFHPLKGDLRGRFALTVSRNWRLTFGWEGEDAIDLDLEDYHG